MSIDYLLLIRSMGSATAENYVNWAVDCLAEGLDTPSLRILAGLSPRVEYDEIEPFFQKTCQELNIDITSQVDKPRQSANLVKQAYDLGEMSAEEALQIMVFLFKKSNYSDPLLAVWFCIDEELDLKGSGYEGSFYFLDEFDSLDEVCKSEWPLFERGSHLNLPNDFYRFIKCDHCGYFGEPKLNRKSLASGVISRIRGLKPKPLLWNTCACCGSCDYQNMIHPQVRAAYFNQMEDIRSDPEGTADSLHMGG
jgi:hypothetical protein